jgi:hypothetical protein
MPATAYSIVSTAAKRSGILGYGDNIDQQDFVDGYETLGDLLAAWNDLRWMSWHLLDMALPSTGQTTPYTIGPNAQFAMTPRPPRIEGAYLRQLVMGGLPVDTPLHIIPAMEQWAVVGLKTLTSFPQYVFLDSAYPIGNVHLHPYPLPGIYEIHILVRDVWPNVLNAQTAFDNYPPATLPAMKYNLARELRQNYGLNKNDELNLLSAHYLSVVKNAQAQLPELQMPKILVRPGLYNIISDTIY